MPALKKLVLSAALAGAAAGPAAAQVTGSNTSSVGGSSTASSSSSSAGGSISDSFAPGATTDTQAFAAPTITGLSLADIGVGGGQSILNASNPFAAFYANPFFAGRAGVGGLVAPGGFGRPLYQVGTGSSTGTFGSSIGGNAFGGSQNAFSTAASASPFSSSTGFGGNQGLTGGFGLNRGFGNQGGFGLNRGFGQQAGSLSGLGGLQAGGVVVAAPGPIAYTAALRFPAPAPVATRVAADLRGMLDRSPGLTSARTIDLFTDGTVVVLRGTVPSAQESETAEGMVRLTPGVFEVRNELKVAAAPVGAPAAPAPAAPAP